jgi:hypothetical protein
MARIFLPFFSKAIIMKSQTKKPKVPKKGNMQKKDRKNTPQPAPKGLTKEDLPDATNESTGQMGSGLRQDSN